MSAARILHLHPAPPEAPSVLDYHAPPRCPDEILTSGLPDWCVRVWLAVRAVQGNNEHTTCGTDYLADRAGKSRTRVSRALAVLEELGWIETVHEGRPSHYRCHIGADETEAIGAAVKAKKGANAGTPGTSAKVRAAHDSEDNVRPAHFQSASRALSPDTPYKEQSSIESGEEEETRATRMDQLPEDAQRYHKQIAALLRATPEARRQRMTQALRAGNLPRADVVRLLNEAEARAGPLATVAAITITANEAEGHFTTARQNHFKSTLATIEEHVRRQSLAPDTPTKRGRRGRPKRALATAEGAGQGEAEAADLDALVRR